MAALRIAEEINARRLASIAALNEIERHVMRFFQLGAAEIGERLGVHRKGPLATEGL